MLPNGKHNNRHRDIVAYLYLKKSNFYSSAILTGQQRVCAKILAQRCVTLHYAATSQARDASCQLDWISLSSKSYLGQIAEHVSH